MQETLGAAENACEGGVRSVFCFRRPSRGIVNATMAAAVLAGGIGVKAHACRSEKSTGVVSQAPERATREKHGRNL
jgi:hypothetical protein